MGCGQKSLMLVGQCHQHLSGFLSKGDLPRVSRQSRLSSSDKVYNEMKQGTVNRSHGICKNVCFSHPSSWIVRYMSSLYLCCLTTGQRKQNTVQCIRHQFISKHMYFSTAIPNMCVLRGHSLNTYG